MLIIFLCLESLISIWIILSTHMIAHKLRLMKNNLVKYGSKRVYKTTEDMAFINKLLALYEECRMSTEDMNYIVNATLQKERIGKFSFSSVMNIATRGFLLMWGLLVIEGAYIAASGEDLYDTLTLCSIGGSIILTLGLSVYILVKALEKRKEQLIGEMIYHVKVIDHKNQEQKKAFDQRIEKKSVGSNEIEDCLLNRDEEKIDTRKEEQLSAKDIAELINTI